jgi:hypothetical protein
MGDNLYIIRDEKNRQTNDDWTKIKMKNALNLALTKVT